MMMVDNIGWLDGIFWTWNTLSMKKVCVWVRALQLDSFMHVFVPLDFPPKHAQISICVATDVKNKLLSEDRLFRDKQLWNAL